MAALSTDPLQSLRPLCFNSPILPKFSSHCTETFLMLYADPDRKVYNLLGLNYGIGRTFFNPASAKVFSRFDALQNAVKNYSIDATPDDRSSGGMFIFKGKQLLYARKNKGTDDHAPLDDVFDICCKVPIA